MFYLAIDRPIVRLREHSMVVRVMKNTLIRIIERQELQFYVELIDNEENLNKKIIVRLDDPITGVQCDYIHIHLIEICFIEIVHHWLVYRIVNGI